MVTPPGEELVGETGEAGELREGGPGGRQKGHHERRCCRAMPVEDQHRIQQRGVPGDLDDLGFGGCRGPNNDPHPQIYV